LVCDMSLTIATLMLAQFSDEFSLSLRSMVGSF